MHHVNLFWKWEICSFHWGLCCCRWNSFHLAPKCVCGTAGCIDFNLDGMLARQLSDFNKYYHSAFSALFYYIFNMSGREREQQHSLPLRSSFLARLSNHIAPRALLFALISRPPAERRRALIRRNKISSSPTDQYRCRQTFELWSGAV